MGQREDDIMIEGNLLSQMCAFHDLDDKAKREAYAKEYFDDFCKKTNIDPEYAYSKLAAFIEEKRKSTIFKYEHYTNLRKILGLDEKSKEER